MAVFMPLDSNLPHLSFNNILKFQTPTQIFKQLVHKQDLEDSYMSNTNFFGNSNVKIHETSHNMTEEKHKSASMHLDFHHPEESTDSDLSVGQEKMDDDKSDTNYDQIDSETAENRSVNMIGDGDEDNSSTASSSHLTNISTRPSNSQNPKEVTDGAIQLSLFQPSPARLQEEIIRNSQLYAEELVRQQLAVSARLQSISGSKIFPHIDPSAFKEKQRLILSTTQEDLEPSLTSKLTFQSSVFAPKTIDHNQNGSNLFCNNKSAINFQNIHSHLSAISQITNNLTSSLKKDDSTSLSSISRESSQSPSNFQHLKHHHQQNMIFHTHQNQLHERNLKFSIDNILKADFGRRITEPLLRSSRPKKAHRDGKQDKDVFKKFNAPAVTKESFSARDDNLGTAESLPRNQSPSSEQGKSENGSKVGGSGTVWPAWVFCTRYSDRPSSGPRVKRPKKPPSDSSLKSEDEKRPRTAFSGPQLARLKHEFNENRYLTEKRRQQLSAELGLNEAQIKIWFQNKRAKIKKSTGQKNPLALQLMAQGLYNHSTVPLSKEEEELQELQAAN